MPPLSFKLLTASVLGLVGLLLLESCAGHGPGSRPLPATAAGGLPDRIGRGLAERSPPVVDSDPAARDAAGEKLARFDALVAAAGGTILWGGYDAKKRLDLKAYTLTRFVPLVWARLYLSTFMFPGPYQVRQEGRYRVLDIEARFRSGLDPGDYPYPFWHAPKKWQAYVGVESLLLVFDHDRLVAALRKSGETATASAVPPWDGRWHWTNADGEEQPRVALFSYLFLPGNPRVAGLETAYRKMELAFRSENCVSCHAPDNPAKASRLLLLDFPNQALAGRHELVSILRANKMPPASREQGRPAGIEDRTTRDSLIQLAREFESAADSALAFEQRLTATGNGSR